MNPPAEPDAPLPTIPASAKTQIDYAVEALRKRLPPGYGILVAAPPDMPFVCVTIADDAACKSMSEAMEAAVVPPETCGAFDPPIAPPPGTLDTPGAYRPASVTTTVPTTDEALRFLATLPRAGALIEHAVAHFGNLLDAVRDAEAAAFARGYVASTAVYSPESARYWADMFDLTERRITAHRAGDEAGSDAATEQLRQLAQQATRKASDAMRSYADAHAAPSTDPVPAFLVGRLRAEIDGLLAACSDRSADAPYDPS